MGWIGRVTATLLWLAVATPLPSWAAAPVALAGRAASSPDGPTRVEGGARVFAVGTMSALASQQTGWLKRVHDLIRQAVFGVAGYDPRGSYAVRLSITPDGRGYGVRLAGVRSRAEEYARIVAAIAATRFPPTPDGLPRTLTYRAFP